MDKTRTAGAAAHFVVLRDWLRSHGSRCMWRQHISRVGFVECWMANGRIFIVLSYSNDGFEILAPVYQGNSTTETLDAATRYICGESEADELKSLRAFKRSVDEALNMGDGSYRP
jgi:hypothetical protein